MRVFALVVFAFLLASCALAQPEPDTLWTHGYGLGTLFACAAPAPNGGFVLAGGHWPHTYVAAIDSSGNELWSHEYNIYNHGVMSGDSASCITPALNGGYFIAGTVYLDTGSLVLSMPYVLHIAENGDSLWAFTYSVLSYIQDAVSVLPSQDGGCVVAVHAGFPVPRLYSLDSMGNVIWQQVVDSTYFIRMCSAPGGGFVVLSYLSDYRPVLHKLDNFGNTVWSRIIPQSGNDLLSLDDGYVVVGGGVASVSLLRTNLAGDSLWQRTCNTGVFDQYPIAVTAPNRGFAILSGVWNGGPSHPTMHLVRTDSEGALLWQRTYQDVSGADPYALLRTSDNGYMLAGWGIGADGGHAFALRTGPERPEATPQPLSPYPLALSLSSYPNPFNGSTTLTFSVPRTMPLSVRAFDLLGREVSTISRGTFSAGQHNVLWNCEDCPSGVYWILMSGDQLNLTRKVMLLK